jgi:hypothetical protein
LVGREVQVVLGVTFAVVRSGLEPLVIAFERGESRQQIQPLVFQCVGHRCRHVVLNLLVEGVRQNTGGRGPALTLDQAALLPRIWLS